MARIADALSVPLMTLLVESTLNVGSDSGLSTVGVGTVNSPATGDARCHRLSGPVPSERPRQFLRNASARTLPSKPKGLGPYLRQATVSGRTKRLLNVEPAIATRATRRASGERSNTLLSVEEQQEWINQSAPPPRKERHATNAIPYTKCALERDLERVHDAWDDSQADRRRDAIYGYLKAVYDLVNWWSAERCEVDRARQAMRLRGLLPLPREDVFAAMIRCTSDPARADKRTRSKWSRVLRYVKMQKDEKEPLTGFIKRKGGINECTIRYGRCLRRLAAEGDQSGRFSAERQATERRWFGGYGLDLKSVTGAGASFVSAGIARPGRQRSSGSERTMIGLRLQVLLVARSKSCRLKSILPYLRPSRSPPAASLSLP
jgi:hypothetical protein